MVLPPGRPDADRRRDTGSPWRPVAPLTIEAPHLLSGVASPSPDEIWVVGQADGRPLAALWDGTRWSLRATPPAAELIGARLEGIAVATNGAGPIAVGGGYDRLLGTEVPVIQQLNGSTWTPWSAPSLTDAGPGTARDYVLTDIARIASDQAWAVGHGFPGGHGLVALHWTGTEWRPAATPAVARGKLLAVSATSPQDVWAVGSANRTGLIVHHDGDGWRPVPCPATRFPLSDVSAVSPDEAWCAGGDSVLRWNGRKWTRVRLPIDSANTVTALPSGEVWVGGGRGDLAHFDGHRWTRVHSPDGLSDTAVWLASTSADSSIWMVGSRQLTGATTTDSHPTITAQSGEG